MAQQPEAPVEKADGTLSPKYAAATKEVSAVCGRMLPDQIRGVNENFAVCGGRFGFKSGNSSFMEFTGLGGGGFGTKYYQATGSIRGDMEMYDLIGSMYVGVDINWVTRAVPDSITGSDQSDIYAGAHVGGAFSGDINDSTYLRTDFKFNFNPGTSLFVGIALVFRFGGGDNAGQGAGAQLQ
jgi:hypothetical protein